MSVGRMRFVAVSCAFVLLASACGMSKRGETKPTGPRTGKYGDPNSLIAASPSASPAASTESTSNPGKKTKKSEGKAANAGSSSAPPAPVAGSLKDFGLYGYRGSGRFLMAPQPYTEIVVEVDYVAGRKPNDSALTHLVNTIAEVTGKKVTLAPINQIPPGNGRYDGEDIKDISEARRNTLSANGKASIWVGYLNGTMRGGGAAGVAVAGTVTAVFLDTINGLPFPPSTKEGIEKTILVQEVGHLFGLVNIGYKSPRDHEDKDHPHHSNNPASVMYWALMTREGLLEFIGNGGSPPTRFDADDLADLRDIAAGKFG